jgi:hypothetical protein
MVVDAAAHVFDVDVPQSFAPAPQLVGNRNLSKTMEMAYVDGEAEERVIDAVAQLGESVHCVDEHARFRFKSEAHLFGFGVTA